MNTKFKVGDEVKVKPDIKKKRGGWWDKERILSSTGIIRSIVKDNVKKPTIASPTGLIIRVEFPGHSSYVCLPEELEYITIVPEELFEI